MWSFGRLVRRTVQRWIGWRLPRDAALAVRRHINDLR
jgi:hypothetical protein